MKTLRNWLRQWIAVPDVTDIKPTLLPFEPAVEYSDAQLAAFDAAEIVVIYSEGLAESDAIATLCREYLKQHQRHRWLMFDTQVRDFSANPKANAVVAKILAEIELELAREALGRAEKRASEVRGDTEAA